MTEVELKNLHFCPVLQVIVLIFGTFTCFIVAYSRGDVSLYLPFISETGAYSPEKCIFSLSLIIGSFLGSVIVFNYYILIRQHPLNEQKLFSYLNVGSFVVGLLSMLGLAGVAAFPMTTVFWAHLLFAGLYFVGSAIYFICISYITFKIEGVSKKFVFRIALSVCILIFLFFIVILFPLSLIKWHEYNNFIPALKKPENQGFDFDEKYNQNKLYTVDGLYNAILYNPGIYLMYKLSKGFTLLLLSSVLEWAIVIVIIVFTLSLIIDLKKYCVLITLTDPTKSAAVNEGPTLTHN